MKIEILKCNKCEVYTLKSKCPECENTALSPKPAKYSPEDNYGKYRRMYKKSKLL